MRTRILSIRKAGRKGFEVKVASPNTTLFCKKADLESPELFQKAMHRNQGRKAVGPAFGELAEVYGGYQTKGNAKLHFDKLLDAAQRI